MATDRYPTTSARHIRFATWRDSIPARRASSSSSSGRDAIRIAFGSRSRWLPVVMRSACPAQATEAPTSATTVLELDGPPSGDVRTVGEGNWSRQRFAGARRPETVGAYRYRTRRVEGGRVIDSRTTRTSRDQERVMAVADGTSIEWTEATWNPTTGCDRVSVGCDNCYALTLSKRLKAMGAKKYQSDGDPRTSGPGFGITVHPDSLQVPYSWRSPRLVFVNSMSDLFHAKVPIGFVCDVFAVMVNTPQHTYQLLTKRSRRLRLMAEKLTWPDNVWMGVSVENVDHLGRIDDLRGIGAAVKFLSCEPLLGPLTGMDLTGIDWVIAGGESGYRYRPVNPSWVFDIRDICKDADVPFFFKQWGGRTPKAGGRELDGELWSEMPERSTLSV